MYNPQPRSGIEVDAKGNLRDPVPGNAAIVVRAFRSAHVKRIFITPKPDWRDEALLIVVGVNPDKRRG